MDLFTIAFNTIIAMHFKCKFQDINIMGEGTLSSFVA